jgi:hypothetical protein
LVGNGSHAIAFCYQAAFAQNRSHRLGEVTAAATGNQRGDEFRMPYRHHLRHHAAEGQADQRGTAATAYEAIIATGA